MKDPKKRKQGLLLSNQFYFVAPAGVIKLEEVPNECGYIEITDKHKIKIIKEAPMRVCKDPTWLFVSSLARRTSKNEGVNLASLPSQTITAIMEILHRGQKSNMNGTETLMFGYLEKEIIKRATSEHNKKTSEQRARTKFYAKTRRENKGVSLEEIQKMWQEKLAKKKET